MKKQISIFAVTVTAIVFFSCSKQEKDIPQPNESTDSQVLVNLVNQQLVFIDPLEVGLKARYEFNGDLTDKTGQHATGIVVGSGLTYTADRNGTANAAIKFTGAYGLDLINIPTQAHSSVAAWVKCDSSFASYTAIVLSPICGPALEQVLNKFCAIISTPATTGVVSGPYNKNWHHVVATYDGSYLKLYVDGIYIGFSANKEVLGLNEVKYFVAYNSNNSHWYGSMDDLRFYTRTLSQTDVTALYKHP